MIASFRPLHVLIIGGGIGGLTLALFLKKAGISCEVLEAFQFKEGAGAAFNIAPNGMKVLDALGLAERVIIRGRVVKEHCFCKNKGKVLARISNGSINQYKQPGVTMARTVLHETLTNEVKSGGIAVSYEKKLVIVTEYADQVVAHFEDGSSVTGTLLIGADGINSKVTSFILPENSGANYIGFTAASGLVPVKTIPDLTERERESINYTFGARGFFAYALMKEDDGMWWWAIRPREKSCQRKN